MRLTNKLRAVEDVDSMAIKLLRAFVIFLFIALVLWEFLVSVVNAIPWDLLLSFLPDWLLPEVFQPLVDQIKQPEPVAQPAGGCTVMPDGILICEDGVHLPESKEGDKQ